MIKKRLILRGINITIGALGIIPLAKEGLITPKVLTAFLCGLGDFALTLIVIFNAFELGYELGKMKYNKEVL